MDNMKIVKAIREYPIDETGALAIPPDENPLYLSEVDVKHVVGGIEIPYDYSEFSEQMSKRTNSLPDGMPVIVALSADAIYFWSNYLDTIGGKLKQDPTKISMERLGLVLQKREGIKYAKAVDYFRLERLETYGFTVYYKSTFNCSYQVTSKNKDYIVGFAKELLVRGGMAEFDWDSNYQIGNVNLL
jgi:hypothetical protein